MHKWPDLVNKIIPSFGKGKIDDIRHKPKHIGHQLGASDKKMKDDKIRLGEICLSPVSL